MVRIPDVVGMTIKEAKEVMGKENIKVGVVVTAPPKHRTDDYNDDDRVIRLRTLEEKQVELLVCQPL